MRHLVGLLSLATLPLVWALPIEAQSDGYIISTSHTRLSLAFLVERGFDCGQLWYMRNGLYARNGYRFATGRGVAAFGDKGWTSNPRQNAIEQANVATLQRFEDAKGCSR